MYNLLIKSDGWSEGGNDSISAERVFEHTAQHISDEYKPGGQLDRTKLRDLPTLFVTEVHGSGLKLAHVGTITEIRIRGRDIAIRYHYDDRISPIPNEDIERLASVLDIDDWEFSKTHWSIKAVDLYSALLSTVRLKCEPVDTTADSLVNRDSVPVVDRRVGAPSNSRRIFLSHSEADTQIARRIARLIEGVCHLRREKILCTSVPGHGLNAGEEWIEALRVAILDGDLVVFLISQAFLASDFCGFELGAAWMAKDGHQRFPIRLQDVSTGQLNALPALRV